MLPHEERIDRLVDKEDEETPLTTPPSGSRGITVEEADISTLRCEGIEVNKKTTLSLIISCSLMMYCLPPNQSPLCFMASILGVRVGTSLLVGGKLNMTPIPRIQHMSRLELFTKLYFMDYIKDLVIPDNNKRLNSTMNLSGYFHVICCRLIMACFAGHSVRDFFFRDHITSQKGAPIQLNHIISGRRLEKITQVMYYTNIFIP